jgi:hypothetical protein
VVKITVGQPRKPQRRPHERHDRLGVEGEAVQAVSVARPGDPKGQFLACLEASKLCRSVHSAQISMTRTGAKPSSATSMPPESRNHRRCPDNQDLPSLPMRFRAVRAILGS